jgi:hypothetical protein
VDFCAETSASWASSSSCVGSSSPAANPLTGASPSVAISENAFGCADLLGVAFRPLRVDGEAERVSSAASEEAVDAVLLARDDLDEWRLAAAGVANEGKLAAAGSPSSSASSMGV